MLSERHKSSARALRRAHQSKNQRGTTDLPPWMLNSRLFRESEVLRREIEQHKWFESEKAGCDIGWERAATDWLMRYGTRD